MPEPDELEISFPEGSETLRVVSLGENTYRLQDSSFVADVFYGDVIEVVRHLDGASVFVRVVSRSGLKITSAILTVAVQEAPELQSLLDRVMALGGNWERAFGGCLIVHLPLNAPMDVEGELRALTESKAGRV
jgi:hypothetical protein